MSPRKIVAVLGVSETHSVFVAKQIAKTNAVLLFDSNALVLNSVFSEIQTVHPNANVEMMICPTSASWEADIIVLSNDSVIDSNSINKIKNVATGKLVLFFENAINNDVESYSYERLQALFPFSKVVHICESKANPCDSFNVSGNDQEAVQTVLKLLTSIGFKASV
jgi:ketopantoate reductase